MNRITNFLFGGTGRTETAAKLGIEIETQFLDSDGQPILSEETLAILASVEGKPDYCELKLELGRHNLELNIKPQKDFATLWPTVCESLGWLHNLCATCGYFAAHEPAPLINYTGELLLVAEERDQIWVDLDGKQALEKLCRCSSVQFTIDVNPEDAICWINKMWAAKVHRYDYTQNDFLWQRYIAESSFGYRADRYGGPNGFMDLDDYVRRLAQNEVVMHQGQSCRKMVGDVEKLDVNLFLRSVWWHYRLRRYSNNLAIEIRPFSRRTDEDILAKWLYLADILGI